MIDGDTSPQVSFISSHMPSNSIYNTTTMAIDNRNYQFDRRGPSSADNSPSSPVFESSSTGLARNSERSLDDYRYRKISQQNADQITVSLYDDYDIDLLS